MKIEKEEVIESLPERFTAVDIKKVDSKKRINLGEKILKLVSAKNKTDAYKVFVGEDGDVLLRPIVAIPSKEAWVYQNPKVLEQIRQGLSESAEGKVTKVKDLDKFIEGL